jgi:hypothetical protein
MSVEKMFGQKLDQVVKKRFPLTQSFFYSGSCARNWFYTPPPPKMDKKKELSKI